MGLALFLLAASSLALTTSGRAIAASRPVPANIAPALTPPVRPEIFQCDTHQSRFDGFYVNGYPTPWTEGVSANIIVHFASVCDTSTINGYNDNCNCVLTFSMIADYRGGDTGYAQSGYMRWYGSYIYHFTEYKQAPGYHYVRNICGACGALGDPEIHQYWVQWWNDCPAPYYACLHLNVDSTRIDNTPFDSHGWWQQPERPFWSGETMFLASDMPGTAVAPTEFRNLYREDYNTNAWGAMYCGMLAIDDNIARWGNAADSCTHFWIWTK